MENHSFDTPIQKISSEEFYFTALELQNLISPPQIEFSARRTNQRVPRSISVSLQPLDDDFQAAGECQWLMSRDISPYGVGLVSYNPIPQVYVRIGLMNDEISALGKVRHNTSIGHKYPLFLVGVEFLKAIQS
jgi:hypothetical protein